MKIDRNSFIRQMMNIVTIYVYCSVAYASILSIILIGDIFNLYKIDYNTLCKTSNKFQFCVECVIFILVSSIIWPIALIPTVNHILFKNFNHIKFE